MPLTFNTHEERMLHPQAKLIPQFMWDDPLLFDSSLNETILELMKASNDEIINHALLFSIAETDSKQLKQSACHCPKPS